MSISVVIPAYNRSRYIAETLESVLAQTLPPDEVLVIDDGSTDDTAAIAESFAPRVRVFRRSNQRVAAARNFGVEQATSEWIAFNDADDLWELNKLELQMKELARHPEADLCYTGHVLLMQEGDIATVDRVTFAPPAEDVRKSLFKGFTFGTGSVVIRRSTFLAVKGFDPACRKNEDYELWLRLLHAGVKFAACREPLFQYRRHEGNTVKDMAWFCECMEHYRQLVLPHLPRSTGWIMHLKFLSEQEVDLAYSLREQGSPLHLDMMARSLLHWPFNDLHRYKAILHMLYTRLRKTSQRVSTGSIS
jgi:glycosyltransferase involved in cell wall biosynthesis